MEIQTKLEALLYLVKTLKQSTYTEQEEIQQIGLYHEEMELEEFLTKTNIFKEKKEGQNEQTKNQKIKEGTSTNSSYYSKETWTD